ncbi:MULTISPECIES: glycosyltransferase family 2 protein [unclassified Acidovorax]|uniref:glycosyltransferase family 2 protein n=1 Tax=unclassified Acidovorax TaxID=2684926 RepID=UPI0028834748|nr:MULTISPECIES: glycosyltransferase family 2 protein [unclassified Acidovorax]
MTTSSTPPSAPWLSVLIPVFNVEDYLTACVQSVLDQSADDAAGVEVLLLDDCSTDSSAQLMQSLAERWPGRLRLLRHDANAGLSAARNTMIDSARGDYLWFLDSDDKLLPGAIAGLRRIVQQHAVDVVLCDFRVWRRHERIKHVLRGERHRATFDGPSGGPQEGGDALAAGLLMTGQLHAWSKISRRALWADGLRFPPGRYFEDMATMPLVARRARSFYYAPQAWVAYRQREGSILASTNVRKAADQSGSLLAFAAERAALQPNDALPDRLPDRLRLALAHQCARNLVGAMRSLHRIGTAEPLPVRQAAAERFRLDFDTASPIPLAALRRQYLWRGWWMRGLRLGRWYAYQPR